MSIQVTPAFVPSVFQFESKSVRALLIDNQPWFVATDVCATLAYVNSRDAISKHVDEDDRNSVAIRDGNKRGNPNQVVINESGVYALVFRSDKPEAKRVKKWVTSEVLPAIRKTGRYEAASQPKPIPAPTPIPVALPGYGSWLVEAAPTAVQMFEAPNKIRVHSEQTKRLRQDFQTVMTAMENLHKRMAVLEGEASPKSVEKPLQIQFVQ